MNEVVARGGEVPRSEGSARTDVLDTSRQWVRLLLKGSSFAFFGLGGLLLSSLLPLVWISASGKERRLRCQRVVAVSFRLFHSYMRWVRLIEVRAIGFENPSGAPSVVVANHPTLIDVTVILSRVPNLCCIVKSSWFQNPLFGVLLRCCGHISAAKGASVGEGVRVIDDVLARLADGHSVLFFVEGTRSPDRVLLPFQRGAFEIACRAQVPIVPVVLRTDQSVLKKEHAWHAVPSALAMLTAELLPAEKGHLGASASAKDAATKTRALFLSKLGLPS